MEHTELFAKYAKLYHLNPLLVASVVEVESSGDPLAIRYEPAWKYFVTPAIFALKNDITEDTERILQSCSFGLMQVMGGVARELGFIGQLPKLFEPDVGLNLGCRKLSLLSQKYKRLEEVLASYNAGTPRLMANGKFVNQAYVDKVLRRMTATMPAVQASLRPKT